jgi:hypothetical protein
MSILANCTTGAKRDLRWITSTSSSFGGRWHCIRQRFFAGSVQSSDAPRFGILKVLEMSECREIRVCLRRIVEQFHSFAPAPESLKRCIRGVRFYHRRFRCAVTDGRRCGDCDLVSCDLGASTIAPSHDSSRGATSCLRCVSITRVDSA